MSAVVSPAARRPNVQAACQDGHAVGGVHKLGLRNVLSATALVMDHGGCSPKALFAPLAAAAIPAHQLSTACIMPTGRIAAGW